MIFKRILFSALRVLVAVVAVVALLWWLGMRMPGKNISKAAPLSPDEVTLREELRADVQMLAGEIGERNMWHYVQLNAAADFIEDSFSRAGLHPRRDSYELRGQACHNIEVEIPGTRPEILLIGAHYDSVFGSPGANDNGSGVAATLALARRFANRKTQHTMRFVAFVNEEPPYFLSGEMGSLVYAGRCKARGDKISAMISLETIGYFSDAPNSQTYPSRVLGAFYPKVGNFIGFVATFTHGRCFVGLIALFPVSMQRFHPKPRRFPRLFPASVGRINGHSGETVIPASWSPTPRRFVILIIIQPATHPTSSITIGLRSSSAEWRK